MGAKWRSRSTHSSHRAALIHDANGDGVVRASTVRKVAGQVFRHLARIVFDAVDERRFAPAENRQADGVHPWSVDDTAVVRSDYPQPDNEVPDPRLTQTHPARPLQLHAGRASRIRLEAADSYGEAQAQHEWAPPSGPLVAPK